ncbi:DeoR/GlpR family DNA-binding transcription regulator [Arcticibacter eurypsychrophilus]|uniref:DeoR/GlpR family DNA-binding transcription regulator n=1 Tax=Arcticibacter eurypsychrophilus TaxID=1434752 RepID=UPI00084CE7EF|nr:DeoR/GlpR family DNA-binding transcription regulator [Arcticibacter eurypsychrophilus]
MLREERFNRILKSLNKEGKVTYDLITKALNVSEDTIRRDIEHLHKSGLLIKVRGGAISVSKNPLNFQDRVNYLSEGKEVIGMKALQLIKSGQTIFMDGGTSMCVLASLLPIDITLRIITNNQAAIPIISKYKNVELIVLGGYYNHETQTTTGWQACEETKQYIADLYFMGTCAIDKKFGITAAFQQDGEVKRSMLNASIKSIVLCNSEKLNCTEFFQVCELSSIDTLITELPGNDKKLNAYRNAELGII